MAFGPITSWQMEKKCKQWQILFSSAPKSLWIVTAAIKFKDSCSMEGKPWQTWTTYNIKKQRHHFGNKGLYSQSYGFSSSHVWMWELDNKGKWALKNWCFQIVVLEKTLENPLDCKEIKPVSLKGNQPWIFTGRTHTEAKTPILWLPDTKSWLNGKVLDAGKDWGQEKGATENKMVGWHHWLNKHEFEQTPEDNGRKRSLACCSP